MKFTSKTTKQKESKQKESKQKESKQKSRRAKSAEKSTIKLLSLQDIPIDIQLLVFIYL